MKNQSFALAVVVLCFASLTANAVECPCPAGYITVTRDGECRCVPEPHMQIFRDAAGLNIRLQSLAPGLLPELSTTLPAQSTMTVRQTNDNLSVEINNLSDDKAKEVLSKVGQPPSKIPEK